MKKHIFFLLLSFTMAYNLSGQVSLKKVPRQISFDAGYRNTFWNRNLSNSATHGFGLEFDYAWQLSGLDHTRPAVYLSIPIGYEGVFPDADTASKHESFIMYGWTVRHELAVNKKLIPYIGYGLLLNRLRIAETEGSIMGHQTRFEVGVNTNFSQKVNFFTRLDYSYASYPSFGTREKIKKQSLGLRFGIRF
jgi:hypothetical protein